MPERKKKTQAVNLDSVGLELGNKPPQALDLEEAVLGAMLVEPSIVEETMDELSPACFYAPKHKLIYEAMASLVSRHDPLDVVTVTQELRSKGKLEEVGGPVFLADLSTNIGAAAHIEYYVRILKQKNIQRELISASCDILKQAYDESVNVDDLMDLAESKIFAAVQDSEKKDVQEVGALINDALDEMQKMQGHTGCTGVRSGFAKLDAVTMGWQKSDLIILAARPSVGKTAFALNVARNAAVEDNIPVAVFSLEMSAIQLVKRLMVTESGFSGEKIKGGVKLEKYEWEELDIKLRALSKAPIYIDDTPGLPIMEFRNKAKRLVKQKGVRLIVIDYLQLMQGPQELKGLREQEVAAVSRMLKLTAKELNVPIIALSQLSRNSVQRTGSNGKPQLSDLRESGSIEQDADIVIFIHRADFLGLSDNPEDKEKAQIILAKHRNGAVGEIDMRYKADRIKFYDTDDTFANEVRQYASAMNTPSPEPQGGAPYGAPMGGEFQNSDF